MISVMSEDHSKEISWLLKEKYLGVMSPAVEKNIMRIKQGEPVAYVIGFVDFLGCKIDLSERPLIPRPETEFWVEQVIQDMSKQKDVATKIKCLDMFAGSGCIGIAVQKSVLSATVDFVDRDAKAIKQIALNCELNNINPSRLRIIKSDIFERVHGSYDYILANPPYVAEDKRSDVAESVLAYEPHHALFGGSDGLVFIEKFLDQVPKHLNKDGQVYLEFDTHQKEKLEKMYPNAKFYQDQFKKWRYLILSLSLLG